MRTPWPFSRLIPASFLRKALALALAALTVLEPSVQAVAAPPVVAPPPVIHLIQDIHAHAEAQRGIAEALERLRHAAGGRLRVGVEGAAGPFDFSLYRAFPDNDIRAAVARDMLAAGKIAGPVFAGLTDGSLELHGIEDPARYIANVDAYRQAAPHQKTALRALAQARRAIEARKAALFPPALRRLDAAVAGYRAGRLSIGDYLEALVAAAPNAPIDFTVETFLAAHRMERSLDFARVEREKTAFVEKLVGSFGPSDAGRVRDWVLSASAEGVGAGIRFDYLFHAARAKGIDPRAFPALDDYVRYLHLADAVDADQLFPAAEALERAAYAESAASVPGAAALIAQDRRVYLTDKLVRFELTREEWTDYRETRPAGPVALDARTLAPFEDFYRIAEERDGVLAANVRQTGVSAVVVGGFHTAGLARALRASGATVEIVRPKISSTVPDQPTAYLTGFAARKTPLERLFSRWKLFLALPAVIGVAHPLVSSVNDDAPRVWVETFRRYVAGRADLRGRVERAARTLLAGETADDAVAAFNETVDRLSRLRERLGRGWLKETVLYLTPLTVGLATGHPWLIGLGVVVKLVVLPAAHIIVDGRAFPQRFIGRVRWSGLFLAAYLGAAATLTVVGVPAPLAAVLALSAPAYLHRLNYRTVTETDSLAARFFFNLLRLPRVAMSTGEPLTPETAEIVARVTRETAAAITEWRHSRNPTGGYEEDAMVALLARYHAEAEARPDNSFMAALALGLARGVTQANLTDDEMRVRSFRDHTWCIMRGIDLAGLAERLNNKLVPNIYEAVNAASQLVRPTLSQAIARGAREGFSEAPKRLMIAAVREWRDRSKTGDEAADLQIRRAWAYAVNLWNGVDDHVHPVIEQGLVEALSDAALTTSEIRGRVETDLLDDIQRHGDVVAKVYGALAISFRTRRRGEQADAVFQGLLAGVRNSTAYGVKKGLQEWRDSSPDVSRRTSEQLIEMIRTTMHARENSDEQARVREGFIQAYGELVESPADLRARIEGDLLLAAGFWKASQYKDDQILRTFLEVYRGVAAASPAATPVIQSAIVSGWRDAIRRQVADLVSTPGDDWRKNIQALPLVLIRFAHAHGIDLSGTDEAIAQGLVDAGLDDVDARGWVTTSLGIAMAGPLDAAGRDRVRILVGAARNLEVRLKGKAAKATAEALAQTINIPDVVRTHLRAWKRAKEPSGSADDQALTAALLRLAAANLVAAQEGENFKRVEDAVFEAGLTPEGLQRRVGHDLTAALDRFLSRPMLPGMEAWDNQVMDPDVRAVAVVYIGLADRFHAAGDRERSHAVLSALSEAVRSAINSGSLEELHGRNLMIFLSNLGYAALRDDLPEVGTQAAAGMVSVMMPDYELPQATAWIRDIFGEANRQQLRAGDALRNGFEQTTLVEWKNVLENLHSDADAVKLVNRLYATASLLFQAGLPETAQVYLEKTLAYLEAHPRVNAAVDPLVRDSIRGLHAASRIILSRNPGELPELMATVQATVGQAAVGPIQDDYEAAFLPAVLYEANREMCRTGNLRYLEITRALGESLYKGDEYTELRTYNLAKAVRYIAEANPEARPAMEAELARLYPNGARALPLASENNAVAITSYAMARAALGHLPEAIEIVKGAVARMAEPSFEALLTPDGAERLRAVFELELAGLMSAASAEPAQLAPLIAHSGDVELSDERRILSRRLAIDPRLSDTDRLLAAVDSIVLAPEKAGWSPRARVNAAVLARTLAPDAFPARLEIWKKSKYVRAIRERFDALDSVAPAAWPGRAFALVGHPEEMAYFDRLYKKSLESFGKAKGVEAFYDWQTKWIPTQRDLWLYAADLARYGMMDESLAVLRASRKMTADALQYFAPGKKLSRYAEDRGILFIPYAVRAYRTVVRENGSILQGGDKDRIASVGPMTVMSAEHVPDSTDWKSEKDFVAAIENAGRLADKFTDPEYRPLVDLVQGRLMRSLGRLSRARDFFRRAVASVVPTSEAQASQASARLELSNLAMLDPALPLPARVDEARRLLDEAKVAPAYEHLDGGYRDLVLELFQCGLRASLPAAAGALVNSARALLSENHRKKGLEALASLGLPCRLVEIALLAPDTAAEVGDALGTLEDWSGGAAGDVMGLARLVHQHVAANPRTFLGGTSDFASLERPEVNVWRVAAAQRTGDVALMRAELSALVTERRVYLPEAAQQLAIVARLMDSPFLRRSFLDAVEAVLDAYRPDDWKGSPDTLRRILDVAVSLGEPRVIFLIDGLSENRDFPLRNHLNGPDGFYTRLEPLLTLSDWAERIIRMDAINPTRAEAFRQQALKVLGADKAPALDAVVGQARFGPAAMARIREATASARQLVDRRLFAEARQALSALPANLASNAEVEAARSAIAAAEEAWEAEKRRSAQALVAAQEAYNHLDFPAAKEALDSIHPDLRNAESVELQRRNDHLLPAWTAYQSGNVDSALKRLGTPPQGDPVPTILRRRIESVGRAGRYLGDRRPQEAQLVLDALNGGVADQAYDEARRRVSDARRRADGAFEDLRRTSTQVGTDLRQIDQIRERVRAVLAVDREYEPVMIAVIGKAQACYDRGNYAGTQAVLRILVEETDIFNPKSENYSRFDRVRKDLERLRSLARAQEMKEWLRKVARLLRAKVDAQMHAEARSATPMTEDDSSLRGQTFVLDPSWTVDGNGYLNVSKLSVLQSQDGSAAQFEEEGVTRRPVTVGQMQIQPNLGFQVSFGTGDDIVRVPVSFVRKVTTSDPQRLVFLPDATGLVVLRDMKKRSMEGRLNFMPDVSAFVQLSAIGTALDYVERHIDALTAGREPVNSQPVLGRLLGLDLSIQNAAVGAAVPVLSTRFADDPSQTGAIVTALDPGTVVSAFQGPPGTGKTTTAVEIIRHLVRPRSDEKGRIVVVTAQAHAGVDNMTLKLRSANVPVIRVASDSAQVRVSHELQMSEREQVERLLDLLEAHEATGAGFAYCVTNNGLRGAKKCFDLLTLYFSDVPMNEIRIRAAAYLREPGDSGVKPDRVSRAGGDARRRVTHPVWAQEEAGQANIAETIAVPLAIDADTAIAFGDQDQLSPGRFEERSVRLIRQEAAAGMPMVWGGLNSLLAPPMLAAFEMSLFEEFYRYAREWTGVTGGDRGAGVLTGFLDVARRSHWLIVAAIVNVYYGDRLHHRDEKKPRNRWEKIRKDTVVFVNTPDGKEETDESEYEADIPEDNGGHAAAPGSSVGGSKSKRNFREVGDVIRAATYHLNSRSAHDGLPRKPGDILILTPYQAQNRLINQTLRWMAIANDYARRETVTPAELEEMSRTVMDHVLACRSARISRDGIRRLLNSMTQMPGARRAGLIDQLYEELRPIYDLRFNATRRIGRADLPEVKVETPTTDEEAASDEEVSDEQSLDQQKADVIEAKTVHRVQGQERKVVIISLVRSDTLGFLAGRTGRRIINVATSRAQENLVVIYSRDRRPPEVVEMEKRLGRYLHQDGLRFEVLRRFPNDLSGLASLRKAWGLSTGNAALDRAIDRWLGPIGENVAFLGLLGIGLSAANPPLIVAGLAIKILVFPALHALPRALGFETPTMDIRSITIFSAAAAALLVVSHLLLVVVLGLPTEAAFWLSLVAPALLHIAHNRAANAPFSANDLGPAKSLEVDTVAGLTAAQPGRRVDYLVPSAEPARPLHYGDTRRVQSGA